MSGFESAIRDLANRKLIGTRIDNTGPHEYNGFVRVGVTVNRDAVNKIFTEMGFLTLKAKYDILEKFSKYLVWLSPVYTGYYVKNWQVSNSTRAKTTHVSQEPNPIGAYVSSGSMRRKMKLSDAEGSAVKDAAEQRLMETLRERFLSYEGTNTTALKDTWAFYNPTPYAEAVESKHGVIAGALTAVGDGW